MNFQEQLKSKKLSVTAIRLAMLETLNQKPHIEASTLLVHIKDKIKTTSIQAVYKNLKILVAHEVIREVKSYNMSSLYEIYDNNHHHLICRSCGHIEDTHCLEATPCLTPSDPKEFQVHEAEIIFWGYCPTCQTNHQTQEGKIQ